MKVKISRGDEVEVITGNDKGRRGTVQSVLRKKNKDGSYDPNRVYVVVSGANMTIKHQKATGRVRTQTGRIEMEAPIHISNVALVGTGGTATRGGYRIEGDDRVRFDRKSGDPLPKPDNS
ncbi:MAG: 50S ribosomal protein L24 [Caldilineaceae bacterium]|nr:50S ribosomal protein L24 [Caldilineaceae bacterium]HRJ40235.1 50S ribosomal protein L24 [Caldilineaceae bacterium]